MYNVIVPNFIKYLFHIFSFIQLFFYIFNIFVCAESQAAPPKEAGSILFNIHGRMYVRLRAEMLAGIWKTAPILMIIVRAFINEIVPAFTTTVHNRSLCHFVRGRIKFPICSVTKEAMKKVCTKIECVYV